MSIQTVGFQVLKAALDEGGQIVGGVAVSGVRVQPPPGFGGDNNLLAGAFALQLCDAAFAETVPIAIRRVHKIDAQIYGFVQGGHCILSGHIAQIRPQRPRAKADLRHAPARAV
jgi:hypothetical protein